MIHQHYIKTQNLTLKQASIFRYLPKQLAESLFIFLICIRPLEALFTEQVYGSQARADCNQFLFFRNGLRMEPDHVRPSFVSTLAKNDIKISFSNFRHISIAFMRHMKLQPNLLDLILPFDEQAGHSEETAQAWYARTNSENLNVPAEREYGFFLVSQAWHNLLRIRLANIDFFFFFFF